MRGPELQFKNFSSSANTQKCPQLFSFASEYCSEILIKDFYESMRFGICARIFYDWSDFGKCKEVRIFLCAKTWHQGQQRARDDALQLQLLRKKKRWGNICLFWEISLTSSHFNLFWRGGGKNTWDETDRGKAISRGVSLHLAQLFTARWGCWHPGRG